MHVARRVESLTSRRAGQERSSDLKPDTPPPGTGELDCDGALNALDIEPFILALLNPPAYAAAHPDCDIALADMDCSGAADPSDVGPFVQLLLGP